MCVCIYVHVYIHIHIYIYICIHIHTVGLEAVGVHERGAGALEVASHLADLLLAEAYIIL